MNRMISVMSVMGAVLVFGLGAPALADASRAEPTKDQLKDQFKSREAALRDLKKSGTVGETVDGYVEAVGAADGQTADVVKAENADRRSLYQILAAEINAENPDAPVKATMETVAIRNAARNVEKAGPDEFLRVAKDHWIRIKDFPRYTKVTKLKTQGKVGETPAGLLEVVKPEDAGDKVVNGVVDEENKARTAEYAALAKKESGDVSAIAKRMAERNASNARIGDMVKGANGEWRKK